MRAKSNATKLIATGLFLLLTLAGIQWWITREPRYSGKPLSHWLLSLRSEDIKVQEEARAVFRALPKAEVSSLLKILQSSDSRVRRFVGRKHIRVGVAGRGSHELLPSGNLLRAMAATALGIVGSNESAVLTALRETATHPSAIIASHSQAALIRITGDPVAPFLSTFADPAKPIDAIKAASVLYALGTNHQTIASQLTNLVDRSSTSDRFELIEFLCANELEPAVVWPVVLRTLDNVTLGANANALNAAMIHLNASTSGSSWAAAAHPAIVACLTNADVNVRGNAIAVLSTCYPVDSALVPPALLKQLLNDPNPGIRAWAAGIQKQLANGRAKIERP